MKQTFIFETLFQKREIFGRFEKIMEVIGIVDALRDAGVKEGDSVFIGDHELEWSD